MTTGGVEITNGGKILTNVAVLATFSPKKLRNLNLKDGTSLGFWLAGSLHCLTQQQPCDFFLIKFLTGANSKL